MKETRKEYVQIKILSNQVRSSIFLSENYYFG